MNLNKCPFFKHTATRVGAVLTTMVFMLLSALATPAAAQGIRIDGTNFPDAAFCNFILTGTHSYYTGEFTTETRRIDYNQDGFLSEEECNNVTHLKIESGTFDNLTGIKNFTNLKELNVKTSTVVLTHLDVSGLTKLEELYVYNIGLESLRVAGCSALRRLSCANNRLPSLDVSGCTALETVTCYNNQLTGILDLSNRTSLRYIDCSDNLLESLNVSGCTGLASDQIYFGSNLKHLNVNGCTAFTHFYCAGGELESLDAGNCSAMVWLGCWNNRLTSLNVSGCPALDTLYCNQNLLTSLNVSGYTNLKVLYCYDNQLTSLNVSGCTALISNEFNFERNPLKQLNVNGCTALTELYWRNSKCLEGLDAGGCINLTVLGCWNNLLTSLNVNGCTALQTLWCHDNRLESLDVRNNTTLKTLWCYGNQLPSLDVSGCTALTTENFSFLSGNPLTSLNVSGCEALTYLQCTNNLLESLNVSGCTAMTYLDCKGNQLSSLDISNTPALAYLDCSGNQLTSFEGSASLQTLWCYNNKLMTTLNVEACAELNSLRCYDNALTGLDVSACTKLTDLWCHNNSALTSLDVTQNKALMYLYCFGDGLTKLKVDNLTALTYLWCYANPLTSLNVSGCTALTELKCYNSLLDSLNVSGCTSLTFNKLVGNDQDGTTNQLQPLRHLNVSGCTAMTKTFDTRTVLGKLESLVARGCTGIKQLNACDTKVLKSLDMSDCTALDAIYAYNNQLTSLNVSGCKALTKLLCHHNQLDSLDVSTCEALQSLQCEFNRLDSLDASGCTNLTYLSCNSNKLKRLNVSGCVALEKLFCQINELDSLTITDHKSLQQLVCWSNKMKRLNVSGCTALSGLKCNTNKLESLNVSGCVELDSLYCYDNRELKQLDVSSCTDLDNLYCYGSGLEDLNVNGCVALKNLWCSDNNLAELELKTCTALSNLQCNNNRLPSLDVSLCKNLITLYCNNNKVLNSLNVSGCTKLAELGCSQNRLTNLDVSTCEALTGLYCSENQLAGLNVKGCAKLNDLWCENNQLESLDVSTCTALADLKCETNHIPLSHLYPVAARKIAFSAHPQSKSISLKAGEVLNLSAEMRLGDVQTQAAIAPSKDHVLEDQGQFQFMRKGSYTLALTNETVKDKTGLVTFTWVINVENSNYTVTLHSDNAEMGSVEGDGVYEEEQDVVVRAKPKEGYRFVKWMHTGTDKAFSTKKDTVFKAHEDLELTAYFEVRTTYNITVAPNDMAWGSVSATGGSNDIYEENADVTINAYPRPGYRFVNWKNGNTVFANTPRYTFKATQNLNLTAYFEETVYDITLQPNNEAWGDVSGEGQYKENADVTIDATPKTGYHFVCWKQITATGEVLFTKTKTYTFKAHEKLNLKAEFEAIPDNALKVNVRPNSGFMGEVSITGDGIYAPGTEVTISATAKVGYRFTDWKSGQDVFATTAEHTFTVTENMDLVAYFRNVPPHTITVSAYPVVGGEVSGGGERVEENANVSIHAVAKAGYKFLNWRHLVFRGGSAPVDEVFAWAPDTTFKAVQNLNLTAYFELLPTYNIALQANNVDWGEVKGGGTYMADSQVVITAIAKPGHNFMEWKKGEEVFSLEESVTFNATENLTLTAYFSDAPMHLIKVTSSNEAWGKAQGSGLYKEYTQATIKAVPERGYRFVQWKYDGAVFSTKADTTFEVTKNMEIVAEFEVAPTHTITLQANNAEWGEVSGGGIYEENTEAAIKAEAKPGYVFVQWTKGEELFALSADTTIKVTEDLSLTAEFELDSSLITEPVTKYTIKVRVNDSTLGRALLSSGVDSARYAEGSDVTIVAAPQVKNSFFVNWVCTDEETGLIEEFSAQPLYSFKATKDLVLVAVFDTEGCDGVPYAKGRVIYLSKPMGKVQIFDALGHILYEGNGTVFPVSSKGAYVLRACDKNYKVLVP